MLTDKVTATTTATDLKSLLETAGVTFPSSGNDKCTGVILQLDPAKPDIVTAYKTDNMRCQPPRRIKPVPL